MRNKLFAGALALAMTCTTVFSGVAPATVKAASVSTVQTQAAENSYVYCYAGLTWAEYWKAEKVYAAGDASSSYKGDTRNELDKGAFDVVTRATANHGLHRGSYQCTATIEGEKGTYNVSYWTDKNTAVLTDGSTINFDKGTITASNGNTDTMKDYKVYGLKYVPVAVKASDYAAFKSKYNVVENAQTLSGGFGEGQLSKYSVTADVTAKTNGLKTVTKNSDGSFSFGTRTEGTDSGIKGQALKTADLANMGAEVKKADGAYGEFLRVDFKSGYGDLGANMQSVTWTYYGKDSTRTTALETYGTKFAADNWMHKAMGIQLGLTDSLRCQLPAGTDGTGYWTITIHALGYKDASYDFEATADNIVVPSTEDADTSELEKKVNEASLLSKENYTAKSWSDFEGELQEAKEVLQDSGSAQAIVNEALSHLTNAINDLVNISGLNKAVSDASTLKESDYTSASWKALQSTLTSAKAVLTNDAATQKEVDSAKEAVTASIKALAKKPAVTTQKKANTTTASKPATKPALKKANVKLSKPALKVGKTTKNKAKVTWKKINKATGYEIQYTTKGFGNKKATKTVKISKAKTTSAQLKKLTKKTKYKVRVRAVYSKAGYQTVTSKWSATKTVKTK
nr:penicillin-binding Tp47 domain C-containing protein [uncultured Anaerobutyricum sp.]